MVIKIHVYRIQLKYPDEAAFKIKLQLFTAELHDTIFTLVCTYTSHSLVFRLVKTPRLIMIIVIITQIAELLSM
ncbi:hypothetical protein VPR01S_04_02530 [Vibrio proteolyticus NBRC 13287]|uniref:Uncharacterized protein n=1 Tax=Vibrio proteolyticus NBRC 13287 TaxID=1219065 RepID=U3BA00_VIBPR|nr:hypothetical protein VPR01S_04_02530 [Vibrio proteolyticus NBRC 13287]